METMQSVHAAHHAVLGQAGGKPLPLGYGDFAAEVDALEHGAGLVDLEACGVIGVRGPEAAVFLNGVVTNNVTALPKGHAQENLLCGNKGKILHTITLLRVRDEEYVVLTEPGELDAVAAHLDAYHVREELQMGVAGLTRLDVIGPQAAEALRRAGLDPNAALQPFAGAAAVCVAHPLGALPRYVLLAPATLAPQLVDALLAAGARLAGYDALDEARIWARVPRFGADFTTDYLPAEGALYDHIAFDKGCYVGQEIHARQHYRGHANRKLVSVDVPESAAATLAVGARLYVAKEGAAEDAGSLTSLARTSRPNGAGMLVRRGIAIVRYAVAAERPALAVALGQPADVSVAPLATDLGSAKP
jgi:folate-binding protein YgfZ